MNNDNVRFKKRNVLVCIALLNYKYVFIAFIVLLMIIKSCVFSIDPVDAGIAKYRYASTAHLLDSTYNGFEVDFCTSYPVSEERLKKMLSQKRFSDFINNLENSVAKEFPNMVDSDIYSVLEWISKKGLPDSIYIFKITGEGISQHRMYTSQNPNDSTYQTETLGGSLQGMVYIEQQHIQEYLRGGYTTYNYIDCFFSTNTDEKYSHISSTTPLTSRQY